MKQKIKDFLITVWYYISYPFRRISERKIDRELARIAAEERAKLLTEKDVEFLKSLGIETTLEELRDRCRRSK